MPRVTVLAITWSVSAGGMLRRLPGAYHVVVVDRFPVTDPSIKNEGDRRLALSMATFFQSELVRRLRESGLFPRVVNLGETEWRPGAEKALKVKGRITRLGEGSGRDEARS